MLKLKKEQGFSLVEIMVAVGILAISITGMLQLFLYCSVQAQMAGAKTAAVSEAQTKIEEIRNESYDDIAVNYISGGTPGNTFDTTIIPGKGVIYLDTSNAELIIIEIVVCWQNKYGHIVGEDTNLNGVLDAGEDTWADGDAGKIDSPVELITYYTRR